MSLSGGMSTRTLEQVTKITNNEEVRFLVLSNENDQTAQYERQRGTSPLQARNRAVEPQEPGQLVKQVVLNEKKGHTSRVCY